MGRTLSIRLWGRSQFTKVTCVLKCQTLISQRFGNMISIIMLFHYKTILHKFSYTSQLFMKPNLFTQIRGNKVVCRKGSSSLLIQHYKVDLLSAACLARFYAGEKRQRLGCKPVLISSEDRLFNCGIHWNSWISKFIAL